MTRSVTAARAWHRVALAGVLLLVVFLSFFRLEQEGYGNLYYAAAVKSMLTDGHNFFFVSFDPGGFVTVDKPPLGLWVQAASAALLGFSGFSLILPQALAGVLSVGLIYHLMRRTFGPTAGLLAAAVLALTPISVAANRNNTMDSQLVLVLLLAAWTVLRAVETGRLRWLLVCAVLVGLGFNIKMLQAYMVLPAFYLLYLLASPLRWWKRLLHLALATAVLLTISLAWAVAVDLTPPDERPYVGSSQSNSALELIIGHNGLSRLLPGGLRALTGAGGPGQARRSDPGGRPPPGQTQGLPLPAGRPPVGQKQNPPPPGGRLGH
ncbi:MAG TPA: phospholipid carrier-dependent glycosyltransferase, partial [Anaerolineales bacterium]|nr:phospholipid carrier-dependent glycosyltransferase [Anaerolineales bacterium]